MHFLCRLFTWSQADRSQDGILECEPLIVQIVLGVMRTQGQSHLTCELLLTHLQSDCGIAVRKCVGHDKFMDMDYEHLLHTLIGV